MRAAVEGADQVAFACLDCDGAYTLIAVTLARVLYLRLGES